MRYICLGSFFSLFSFLPMAAWAQNVGMPYEHNSRALKELSKNPWRKSLESKGYIDRSLPRPYRYAIPITDLGSPDSKLMVTYAPRMPGDVGNKGILLFAKFRLD